MQFSVSKGDLCRCLSLLAGIVAKKSTIPVLSSVKLEASGETLTVTGTDLEVGLTVTVEAKVEQAGIITLPAKRLFDYARLLPEGDVKFKVDTEKSYATITAGKIRTRIAGMSAESFPELPAAPEPALVTPADTIARLIKRVKFAVSPCESRFTINGCLVEATATALRMVATDGHRLALAETPCSGVMPFRFILPTVAANAVLTLAGKSKENVYVSYDDNHLFFRVGTDATLTARKLTGNFPDYERVFPRDTKILLTVNREELADSLARVKQFANETSKCVKVTLGSGGMELATNNAEGESGETVACECSGEALEIGFNGGYLSDFLGVDSTEAVTLHLSSANVAMEMRSAGDAGYRYAVMPMRV